MRTGGWLLVWASVIFHADASTCSAPTAPTCEASSEEGCDATAGTMTRGLQEHLEMETAPVSSLLQTMDNASAATGIPSPLGSKAVGTLHANCGGILLSDTGRYCSFAADMGVKPFAQAIAGAFGIPAMISSKFPSKGPVVKVCVVLDPSRGNLGFSIGAGLPMGFFTATSFALDPSGCTSKSIAPYWTPDCEKKEDAMKAHLSIQGGFALKFGPADFAASAGMYIDLDHSNDGLLTPGSFLEHMASLDLTKPPTLDFRLLLQVGGKTSVTKALVKMGGKLKVDFTKIAEVEFNFRVMFTQESGKMPKLMIGLSILGQLSLSKLFSGLTQMCDAAGAMPGMDAIAGSPLCKDPPSAEGSIEMVFHLDTAGSVATHIKIRGSASSGLGDSVEEEKTVQIVFDVEKGFKLCVQKDCFELSMPDLPDLPDVDMPDVDVPDVDVPDMPDAPNITVDVVPDVPKLGFTSGAWRGTEPVTMAFACVAILMAAATNFDVLFS
eukprot:gnl/TRDRNA2_/TRDRNA2_93463_c0_seq2.p1 gnl/TRDRNA2_/TRDRNA2_93463_c0~~gnl/TRDRNA2_/TRDRNA2_93463_c0_seq2.p1  ORF type:complete len:517 (-),score=62.07 gnl/TRDRNA2_/TRDRNA2_93463_c0_seq2:220-1704(-)